jgi:lantibiotic leader peptide-processing serine protease
MVRRNTLVPALAVIAGFALAACSDSEITKPAITPGEALLSMSGRSAAGSQYVIIGANGALPSNLAERVAAAGGALLKAHSEIGVAVATGNAAFAAAARGIPGVESVARDLVYEQPAPQRVVDLAADQVTPSSATNPNTNAFYFLQWAPGAIAAPTAWQNGYQGLGARVAILDGGLYTAHLDLAGQIDVANSRSFACPRPPAPPVTDPPTPWPGPPEFCPDGLSAFNNDHGTFWHGTHVAGIVAAADNSRGVIGIAPKAALIGVKVLDGGSGHFSWLIDGIMYAAKPIAEGGAGAQVINMSLGALVDRAENSMGDIQAFDKAISRATDYAWKRGVTVVGAAGNEAAPLGKRYFSFPAMSQHVISVAATGPVGWAVGWPNGATNFSRKASYTNIGKKGVDLAAPGGDAVLPGEDLCLTQFFGSDPRFGIPCWVFDLYISTSRAGYSWAAGTSMASPVVAGVAALIVGKYNGMITPAGVKAKLEQGAMDLGKPGNDDVYGKGWVNAWNSVR